MRLTLFYLGCCLMFCFACASDDNQVVDQGVMKDNAVAIKFAQKSTQETGVKFRNLVKEDLASIYNVLGFQYLYNGGGVATADFNNDGLQDIYFTGNTVQDQLYINEGNFKFDDISAKAGIQDALWSNGVSVVDINNDGWLDIYVCKGGPDKNPNNRRNKFFINQGNLTFKEQAAEMGLADSNISTQAVFLDYDSDGDLDCFVMNNAVSFSGDVFGNQDRIKNPQFVDQSSCHLYQNNNGKFTKKTSEAGLLWMSYGLGLMVDDFNEDGRPDIYISNDYYLPDAMYINQGDGTFVDQIKSRTKHTSFYGMGVDAADINQDGHIDFLTLDMSSNDHVRSKTLMPSMNIDLFYTLTDYLQYHHQYMFNALQLNHGDGTFSNVAQMAGLANSDWSWSTLFADFDLNGTPDCYITNGIERYLNDNDFKSRMDALAAEQKAGKKLSNEDKIGLYESMPQLKISNYMYSNNGDLSFTDVSEKWSLADKNNSNGAAYADLDNDGDLDLVVNNLDVTASIYENNAASKQNYLKVKVPFNQFGMKLQLIANGRTHYATYQTVRGYQSSVSNEIVFGLGNTTQIDSLIVHYPNGASRFMTGLKANQTIDLARAKLQNYTAKRTSTYQYFATTDASEVGIATIQTENSYNDLKKEVLLPYLQSTRGPFLSKADVNNDGLEDVFVGGPANKSGVLYIQSPNGSFNSVTQPFSIDATSEDWGSTFFDADGDGDLDLYVCSGGNEFDPNSPKLRDRLYLNDGAGGFNKGNNLPTINQVNAVVAAHDVDSDDDLDLFVGGRQRTQSYPVSNPSYLLINNGGKFVQDQNNQALFADLGMVNDALWIDLNKDGNEELVIASEWNKISVLSNESGSFKDVSHVWNTSELKGWWQSITAGDWDSDGDQDLLIGNLGLNSKFAASEKKPLRLYSGDFDNNGTHDLVLSKKYKDEYVPVRGLQCSSEQMPEIKERFGTYRDFADASIDQVLNIDLSSSDDAIFETNTFESGILINNGTSFDFKALPRLAQVFPIMSSISQDVNGDGKMDIILFGNIYNTEVETPRLDARSGLVLINNGSNDFTPKWDTGIDINANIKDAIPIGVAGDIKILVSQNNGNLRLVSKR